LITFRLRKDSRDATAWLRRLQVRSDGGRIRQISPPKKHRSQLDIPPGADHLDTGQAIDKVDLIFTEPHAVLPAWQVTAATLPGIDDHFWDWMLWLATKHQAGKAGLVAANSPTCMSICWPRAGTRTNRPDRAVRGS
jgi:hypothetical protein